MTARLASGETDLVGAWVLEGGRVVCDAVEQRIDEVIVGLEEVARDSSGWETLYRDPADGRYWELTYPQGEMQGGGPRRLTCISVDIAADKYDQGETGFLDLR